MMTRTYGRRKPGVAKTLSDSMNDAVSQGSFRDYHLSSSSSQDTEPHDFFSLPFPSQESSSIWHSSSLDPSSSHHNSFSKSHFDGDSHNGDVRRAKKPKYGKSGKNEGRSLSSSSSGTPAPLTSTLMEAQEFGEMMEHVDEVNFALDGLKKGQQLRIRRASLSSLLSICGSPQQRRFLRAQGISRTIIDAVLGLSLDDTPSNLAAAALIFVLTADCQDEHLMESRGCIQFLIKLLKPVISSGTEGKARKIGYKLLSILKDADAARDTTKTQDSSSGDIVSKVLEIFASCKELKSITSYNSGTKMPELSPKWIALLTMEKACLSKISFEDTSGTMRKACGNFKEKLRELGGLDAVFEVAMNCHSVMERWMKHGSDSVQDQNDDLNKQSLMLLLKCLKIMENATFLSKDNQSHLLGIKRSLDSHGSRLSFTELMISVIKILSGLYPRKVSPTAHKKEMPSDYSNGIQQENKEVITISSTTSSTVGCSVSQYSQSNVQLDCSASASETSTMSMNDPCMVDMRVSSSISGSFSGRLNSLSSGTSKSCNGSRANSGLGGEPDFTKYNMCSSVEDSQDPYAFDFDDFEPSKWELLSGKQNTRAQKSKQRGRKIEIEYQHQPPISQQESNNRLNSHEESSYRDHHDSHQISGPRNTDEECLSLLPDCLLSAVKVLMNLTNDNAIGCRQIASCGGLETMSTLIARHFPSFSSSPSLFNEIEPKSLCAEPYHQNDRHLTDQELDFLVAILGLLVNLVEKDGLNRSRLAAASVPIPNSEGIEESEQEMIPLLCSIFLANRGASDTTEEVKHFTLEDEEAVLEGEKEAEKMIVEAYSALLLAFLSTESRSIRNAIADHLPNHKLAILVPVLERFVAFHLTLNMIPPETHKTVSEVIESCRIP